MLVSAMAMTYHIPKLKIVQVLLVLLLPLAFVAQKGTMASGDTTLLKKYIAAGVPSPYRNWTPDDCIKAVNVLAGLGKSKALPLPLHNNASGLILDKITQSANAWFIESKKLNTVQKLAVGSQLVKPITNLMIRYINEGKLKNNKFRCSNEIRMFMITLLKSMDNMMELLNVYLAETKTLTTKQQEGLDQVRRGVSTTMGGVFQTLERECDNYESNDMCLLADAFFKFYARHRNAIDKLSRNEFDLRKSKISKGHKLGCVKHAAKG